MMLCEKCEKQFELDKACICTDSKIPQTKIICVAGYSGSGKTTMIKLMQKYLPNSYFITKDEEITQIQNPSELEKVYGVPVNAEHIFDYFKEVVAFRENIDVASIHTNITYQTKFSDLITIYLEQRYEEKLADILTRTTPDFVVLEWSSLPKFKIWNEANYRVVVKPAKWGLLVENLVKRVKRTPVTLDIARVRNLYIKEIIENAENVTHEIINNYDGEYEQTIKDFCSELVKNGT
jgi:dephospho-CoA kinase